MIRRLIKTKVPKNYKNYIVRFHETKSGSDSTSTQVSASFFDKEQVSISDTTDKALNIDDDDEEDMEQMFVEGPAGIEWGGPTRGGARPEPTRFGDWERKGRASDF